MRSLILLTASICFFFTEVVGETTFLLHNKCGDTVWPAIQPGAGRPVLARGGFRLLPNRSYSVRVPDGWSGRIWGRQGCKFDENGAGCCATGDCGGKLYCDGLGGAPPATLAEITHGERDFYDVSLVDGYNLAVSVTPVRGQGRCPSAGCIRDLNQMCPRPLQVRSGDNQVLACRSACSAFKQPKFCCTGDYANPQTCPPTFYSRIFKAACPKAYSYAYDDPTSLVTCSRASYLITFCPRHY